MDYVDVFVAAVPAENRGKYVAFARKTAVVFKEFGALSVVECWEDDVPEGEVTSLPLAVQRAEGESVVLSYITWPSKAVRNAGMEKVMSDPRLEGMDALMPFDGRRLIYGGFKVVLET